MGVTLTVSQIRNALRSNSRGSVTGDGAPSTRELGSLLHRVLFNLLDANSPCRISEMVRRLEPDLALWKSTIIDRTYDELLGPLLTQQAAAHQEKGRQVLDMWQATQAACNFLAELWWQITSEGKSDETQSDWFHAERPVSREITRPGSPPVAVIGQIDAVLQIPRQSQICLLEWKLGRTMPELDVAQASLYHLLLEGDRGLTSNSVAVVSFLPEKREQLFSAAEIEVSRSHLLEVIFQLADANSHHTHTKTTISEDRPRPPTSISPSAPSTKIDGLQNLDQAKWVSQTQEEILRVLRMNRAACSNGRPPIVGTSLVRFFVVPNRGVLVKSVLKLAQELQLPLRLDEPPEFTVSDGMIAIDVPRVDRQSVSYSAVRPQFVKPPLPQGGTRFPVGVDLFGRWEWCDLNDPSSAHVLVAGTPGSGKSQWLRATIAALIETNTPETLELLLIDPKQNAFQFLRESPYLSRPIVVPGKDNVFEILEDAVKQMGERNHELAEAGCQSLSQLMEKAKEPRRRMVIVCDEYADLLAQYSKKSDRDSLELLFRRIAAVGRAPGFHLILATQQPKATILSTSIRSLLAAKVVLRVTKRIESQLALDEPGAERLLGNGDLYYKCIGNARRFQGLWLSESEESLFSASEEVVNKLI